MHVCMYARTHNIVLKLITLTIIVAIHDHCHHRPLKGHLGYHTSDHLPVNRGFDRHLGYLGGGESYDHGCRYGQWGGG